MRSVEPLKTLGKLRGSRVSGTLIIQCIFETFAQDLVAIVPEFLSSCPLLSHTQMY